MPLNLKRYFLKGNNELFHLFAELLYKGPLAQRAWLIQDLYNNHNQINFYTNNATFIKSQLDTLNQFMSLIATMLPVHYSEKSVLFDVFTFGGYRLRIIIADKITAIK